MFYQDVAYASETYRGVYFTEYRPNDVRREGSEAQSFVDDNGFEPNTVYWFRFETLSWRVLERGEDSALIVSEKVLDSHEFFPAAKGEGGTKANDYQASSIRAFLNGAFYETAFSDAERTNFAGDGDKLFLLREEDVSNPDLGFSSDADRAFEATDYARLQGLNMSGGARWWLGSGNDIYDFYARYVDGSGYAGYNQYVYFTSLGVVPALKIKLLDESTQPIEEEKTDQKEEEVKGEIFLSINGHKISVKLEENEATKALIELLKAGDITYRARDYGGFEKVGELGHTLPRSETQMTTEAGDVILYSGNQIVLFYGSNSWAYTKLGTVQDISAKEWKDILTESDSITVTISLR